MHSKKIALIELSCSRPELNEPLGICNIAAYIDNNFPHTSQKVELFWQKVDKFEYDASKTSEYLLIGISSQINTLDSLQYLYKKIRSISTDTPIVIGNIISVFAAEKIIDMFPDVIVCEGEGEIAFAEIYKSMESNGGSISTEFLHKIAGLVFKENSKVVRTQKELIHLSSLPPPRRDFTQHLVKVGGIVRLEASRGCHWGRCEFCSVAERFGRGCYRRFDTDRVLQDLQAICEIGARSPYFSDEDFFGGNYHDSIELAKKITRLKTEGVFPKDLNFFISILASDITHPVGKKALLEWKKAGLREVFVGIEAGSVEEIKRFSKKSSVITNSTAIQTLQNMGFQIDIGFIMFDPNMTIEDIKHNIDWLSNQKLDEIDSRVTKSLRIIPKTGLEKLYNHLICGPLSVDEIQYPYEFIDSRVAYLKKEYDNFEKITQMDVYSLLGSARGEIESEDIRINRKRKLAKVRDLELHYLSGLIKYLESGIDNDLIRKLSIDLLKEKKEILYS